MKRVEDLRKKIELTRELLGDALKGKEILLEQAFCAILTQGHILLEGPPGSGKTTLARLLAQTLGADFRRIQCTSDLLPSDVVGFLRLNPKSTEFEFRRGPIFSHLLLADELNRSNPKTQSALLEAMAESTVTVDGTTYLLPKPFFVIATQNPAESHGVYPLAESQLDRFMFVLPFDFPNSDEEKAVYRRGSEWNPLSNSALLKNTLSLDQILAIQPVIQGIRIEESVLTYLNELVRGSRSLPGISYGVSVRGGLQFLSAVKALSFLRGRSFVTPVEIQDLAVPCLAHRLGFLDQTQSHSQNHSKKQDAVKTLLKQISSPK